ncbi:MAG: hypothetical protein HYW70_00425 [Candidatus Nealsonbacteria bacterium]|nr:hypothetical protein [Candidatus Nealsonbacteria bacterium]
MLNKSFTLIEVITAIFLISVGILGVFGLTQRTFATISFSLDKLTASYLAQEGIEIARNIRDGNWLEQRTSPLLPWDDGMPQGAFEADYQAQSLTQAYNGAFLNIQNGGFYGYGAGNQSKFKRKITLQKPDSSTINVLTEVFWQDRGKSHTVLTEENLYNWR